MSTAAVVLKPGQSPKPTGTDVPRLSRRVVRKKKTTPTGKPVQKRPIPSFMKEKPPSVWVMSTSLAAVMLGITLPMLAAMLAVQAPDLFGLHSAQFALLVPPGYWFIDLSLCVFLVMMANAGLMVCAWASDEPDAFLFNAWISIIVLVAAYVVPQFVDLSCRSWPGGCIPSSVHFVWLR
jgi:hypothetical protein